MKTTTLLGCMVFGLVLQVVRADNPAPGLLARLRFEHVLDQVRSQPSLRPLAFGLLRAVAENRGDTVSAEVAEQFGFDPRELSSQNYKFNEFRVPAFAALGKLGTEEAITYLESVKASDFSSSEVYDLWPAAQAALQGARLDRISNPQEKAIFLEATIREYQNVIGNGYLANWAAEELCNRGVLTSYAVVEQLLYDRNRQAAPDNARFCEQRMRAVMSDPDRATAIGSVLQVTDGLADKRLMQWAISELTAMKSEQADLVMERFEQEVLALPDGSPQKRELMPYADAVRRRNGMVPPRSAQRENQ